MADLEASVRGAFASHFGGVPDLVARAPGRVNLIGEHTDYNDGFVLPMAISGATMAAVRARGDGVLRIYAVDQMAETQFALDQPIRPDASAPWSNYVRGVAHALQDGGLPLLGADMVIAGDVPQGAGLSSSASLEMASGLALAALAGSPDFDRTALALAGQRAEHEFAGCKCGIMDQLVSAHGKAGHASLIDCRSLTIEAVPMPDDWAVMIVHSGEERQLVAGEYDVRRAQCETAARHHGVVALRDLSLESLEAKRGDLDFTSYKRARHVVSENARTLAAAKALRSSDLAGLGALMAQSHASMRDNFAITTPNIDHLVAILHEAIGGDGGARMTGGGFGGAVVAMIARRDVERIMAAIIRAYRTPNGDVPQIMLEVPAAGASII